MEVVEAEAEEGGGDGGCWLQVAAVVAGGPPGPAVPGSGLLGSYSLVAAGCCSWLMTIRQWIQHKTPGRCPGGGGGCGGAAAASSL